MTIGLRYRNTGVARKLKWLPDGSHNVTNTKDLYNSVVCFRYATSKSSHYVIRRHQLSTTSSSSIQCPEEAGTIARQLAYDLLQTKQSTPAIHNMDSMLAHTGIETSTQRIDSTKKYHHDDETNTALSPPLHVATTYTRPADGIYKENDSIYIREDNPTRLQLEQTVFQLETYGKEYNDTITDCMSLAYSSGMMAASSIILAHQLPLHVILPNDLYHGVRSVLFDVFTRFQVSVEYMDMVNDENYEQLQKCVAEHTKHHKNVILWIETPSNPLCQVIDILKVSHMLKHHDTTNDVTIVVDSTLAPPVITQPLLFGADIVMHSATKYLGGHSDAMCGIVTASPYTSKGCDLFPQLKKVQALVGGIASTLDSWLIMRGMRTLPMRVEKQSSTALQIATYLHQHRNVTHVHYPGLPTNTKQYEIAKRQMKTIQDHIHLFGGVLSFEMDHEHKAYAFAGALQMIKRATSLGGTETLIEHRYSIEPISCQTSPKGLLRMSVGLENPIDLIHDLEFAFHIVDQMFPQNER
jgi:cystathionine gamma-synthase